MTYSTKASKVMRVKRAVGKGMEHLHILLIAVLFGYAFVMMLVKFAEKDWPQATFWLVVLLGVSIETKLRSVMDVVNELKWRQR